MVLYSSSTLVNLLYVIAAVWLFWRQSQVLNRMGRLVARRFAQEQSGFKPTLRVIPYPALVSTLCFGFVPFLQLALSIGLELRHMDMGDRMTPAMIFVLHIRNALFYVGALAAAAHKRVIYREDGPAHRGSPPTSSDQPPISQHLRLPVRS